MKNLNLDPLKVASIETLSKTSSPVWCKLSSSCSMSEFLILGLAELIYTLFETVNLEIVYKNCAQRNIIWVVRSTALKLGQVRFMIVCTMDSFRICFKIELLIQWTSSILDLCFSQYRQDHVQVVNYKPAINASFKVSA